ncbi:D-alanyl-D-alanine carboxypeptidase family protein [Parvibium lacunae]|uniref:serine-type D-Ala-D-Ala carboxypeptidase n=1 Tax=Parvibium lacunae TaxID=1888893 RepID=A0A368L014_9BURK|nr:D-alanyl-D-alanine carboxypeptidase family protein [Parvibium lacunae]RCS56890.1 D-alanyl-D-alanine carboxypeptidase [Parvibium lacunae]
MKNFLSRVRPASRVWLFLFVSLIGLSSVQAQTPIGMAPVPQMTAKSWLLLDVTSNQVLAGHEVDSRIEPASLTKLMTAYLVFGALKQQVLTLNQTVPVSTAAYKMGGSRTFIDPKVPVTVEELIKGMIVQSGNDATVALAEAVGGGTEAGFVTMMNREAQRLGMKGTNFMNASGMPDPQHYTTARDLARLATRLIQDYPEQYHYYAIKDFTYNKIKQENRNRLLFVDPTVDGVKTGHTETAGYCLIASSKRGQRRLLSVVLGTNSMDTRAQESLRLLNYGFQYYDAVKVYDGNQVVSSPEIWKGKSSQVKIGANQPIYVSLPKGTAERVQANLEIKQPLVAPVAAGQVLGTIKFTVDGKVVAEVPATALEAVPVAGVFGRAWDTVRLWFK